MKYYKIVAKQRDLVNLPIIFFYVFHLRDTIQSRKRNRIYMAYMLGRKIHQYDIV